MLAGRSWVTRLEGVRRRDDARLVITGDGQAGRCDPLRQAPVSDPRLGNPTRIRLGFSDRIAKASTRRLVFLCRSAEGRNRRWDRPQGPDVAQEEVLGEGKAV